MDDFWQTEMLIRKVVIDAGKSIPQYTQKIAKKSEDVQKDVS